MSWKSKSSDLSLPVIGSLDLDPLSSDDLPTNPAMSGTNHELLVTPTNSANFFRLSR
jgi:hypothetical protein